MEEELVYIFRIFVAVLCGGLIGLGREKNGKRACGPISSSPPPPPS